MSAATGCERVKEDILTVYRSSGRRLQKINASTSKSKETIELPRTFNRRSVLPLFNNLSMVTHDIEGTELTMDIPNGYVAVLDKDGVQHEGDLIDVTPSEVIIKPHGTGSAGSSDDDTYDDDGLHEEKVTGGALHLKNYMAMQYLERFSSREITLSYLLSGLGWIAKHDLFLDPINSRLIAFKTSAVIRNDTGVTFDLSSLRLAIGNPAMPKGGFGPQIEEVSLPAPQMSGYAAEAEMSSDMMAERKGAPMSSMRMAAAASPVVTQSRMKRQSSEPVEMNAIADDGVEDYGFIDVGRQRLGQKGNYEILNLVNIPIDTLYYFEMESGNTDVQLVYQFTVPEDTHIPEGDVMVTSYDSETKTLGGYLGQSRIKEHFQGEEVDIKLRGSKLIKAECQIKSVVSDRPTGTGGPKDDGDRRVLELLNDVDIEELKEYADSGLFDLSDLLELMSRQPKSLPMIGRLARAAQAKSAMELSAEGMQEAIDMAAARERKGTVGTGGKKGHLTMKDVQDITVLLKKDVPQIRRTKIHCSFTNSSSRMPATVVASYPSITREKVVSMTFPPSRERKGKMEFDIEVPPNTQVDFDLEIVTDVPGGTGGHRAHHSRDIHPAHLPYT